MGSCLSAESSTDAASSRHHYVSVPADQPSSPPSTTLDLDTASKGKMVERDEAGLEMRLHRIPGRFFLNASTHSASLFSKQGKKGINQDAMIVWEVFTFFFFVFLSFTFHSSLILYVLSTVDAYVDDDMILFGPIV